MSNKSYDYRTSYIDLLLNCLFLFLFMFMLSILIKPAKPIEHEGIKRDAQYIIQMSWDPNLDCDVDLWVKDPMGNIVFFRDKDIGLMHLERDDLGKYGDYVVLNNKTIINQINEEVWTLRGPVTGEFTVNSHLYSCRPDSNLATVSQTLDSKYPLGKVMDVSVHFKLIRVNPAYSEIDNRDIVLHKVWEERTVYKFTIAEDGSATITDDITQEKLIKDKKE